MEINFTRKDFNYLLKYEKLVWKDLITRRLAVFSVFLIAGIFCLLDTIDRYTKTGILTGITFSISIAVFLSCIFILVYYLLLRRKAMVRTKYVIGCYKNENETLTFHIDTWGISLSQFEVTTEFKWSYFAGYKVYGNSLIIIPKHHSFQELFFEKDEMPEGMYEEVLIILKTKFGSKGNRIS